MNSKNETTTRAEIHAVAEKLLPYAALKQATRHPLYIGMQGGGVYALTEGWEKQEVKSQLPLIYSALELEEAVQNNPEGSFYIPHDSATTQDLICSIVERNGGRAVVFVEMK